MNELEPIATYLVLAPSLGAGEAADVGAGVGGEAIAFPPSLTLPGLICRSRGIGRSPGSRPRSRRGSTAATRTSWRPGPRCLGISGDPHANASCVSSLQAKLESSSVETNESLRE
jgi:hypothetical protein